MDEIYTIKGIKKNNHQDSVIATSSIPMRKYFKPSYFCKQDVGSHGLSKNG